MTNLGNLVHLSSVTVIDSSGTKRYGFRIYDDYQSVTKDYFDDRFNKIFQSHLDLLKLVIQAYSKSENEKDKVKLFLQYIKNEEKGMYINEEYYNWLAIESLFQDSQVELRCFECEDSNGHITLARYSFSHCNHPQNNGIDIWFCPACGERYCLNEKKDALIVFNTPIFQM